MSQRYLDDWLQAFVEYSSFGEAPLKMLFWTGVSTIAGALRRRVWIDQKYFQWLPNFYVIFVAPPGIVSKSTTANIGMNLLRALQGIKFGPDVITWQALITSLSKATTSEADPQAPGEFMPMSAVTFCSDELGNLLNPQDDNLVSALITLWDGKQGDFRKETKTSGNDQIENPWCNIIGCTTPSWISKSFPEYMIEGGFISRCVFIYEEQKRQLVPYVDEVVPPNFEEMRGKLIHDLEMISMMFGEYKITPEARAWGKAWYDRHWTNRPSNLTGSQFSGYMARKQTHMHKLAMVLAASESDATEIRSKHLEAAYGIITSVEKDMPRVFARIGQNDITRASFEIVSLVEANPGISQVDLFRQLFRTLSYKDFESALSGAINAGHIQSRQEGNTIVLRPARRPEASSDRAAGGR
jgi:hypothetical protein